MIDIDACFKTEQKVWKWLVCDLFQGDPIEILKKDSLQWVSAVVQRYDVGANVVEAMFFDQSSSIVPLDIVRPVLSWNSDTSEW